MPVILTIDQGNTRTKVEVFTDPASGAVYSAVMEEPDLERLDAIITEYGVTVGAMCSIKHVDPRLAETLRRMLPGGLLLLTHETPVPVRVDYDTPTTLGPDRVAALCGAASLYPGRDLLVVDAGTAITLDLLAGSPCTAVFGGEAPEAATPAFLGGNISAGVSLRLKALHEHTASLPQVPADGPLPPIGRDTATALRCGAIHGAAREILGTLADARAHWGRPFTLLLTGGDAPLLLPLLSDSSTLPSRDERATVFGGKAPEQRAASVEYSPDLIPAGLISILKHNDYI